MLPPITAALIGIRSQASKEVKGLQDFIYDEYYELTEWSIGTTDWLSYEFFNSSRTKGYAIVYARERRLYNKVCEI